jgi:hypothetical protein
MHTQQKDRSHGSDPHSGHKGNGVAQPKKPRTNWKSKANKLQRELDDKTGKLERIQEKHQELWDAFNSLRVKGLSEREAIRLRRYEHLISRLVNLPLPDQKSRDRLTEVIEDELKYMKDLVWAIPV